MVIRMQGFNMWRMRSFDRNARVDYWKLFYKVIQEQKEYTLDAGLKYAPHSDRLWVGSAKNINFPIMAEII
ncbi:hypothetical protein ECZC01_14210 [Escherichia coli]|nr:hypothetical protein TUM13867_31930 [Escherichia coli]BDG99142.1 hypothetical protein TUM20902_22560 [Escherichia coli]GHK33451.1 hypothetical protein ECZU06_05760 [Escherichia coli]GHK69804.1 hypothetical protein ECZU12_12150 [Escherichia coli]GHK88869.1 hypothetical protein ECZU17_48060 [Escherichia coli]